MKTLIEFKNTNFAYDAKNAFNDFNMEILEEDIITLIGPRGSGKTTILKMLCNKLPNDTVYYNGVSLPLSNRKDLRNDIVVIFDSPLLLSTVKEELNRFISKLDIPKEEIEIRVKELNKYFNISNLLDLNINKLSLEEEYLIKILRYLIIKPKFLAIDNLLSLLNKVHIKKFFDYIKKNKITLLNVTNDLELALYGNKMFVLENFVLILEGSPISILKTDTLLKRLGFKLPLVVDLSIELIHYDILKKVHTDKDKLVNALWK